MNKLIIVGNGFDLAHGLPTSYKSFIDYAWSNMIQNYDNTLFSNLTTINKRYWDLFEDIKCQNYTEFKDALLSKINNSPKYTIDRILGARNKLAITARDNIYTGITVFNFKNKFFEHISSNDVENWVDIENEYYTLLVGLAQNKDLSYDGKDIKQLNTEFNQIKNLLKHYLEEEVEGQINQHIDKCVNDSIVELFEYKCKQLSANKNSSYLLEYSRKYHDHVLDFDRSVQNDSFITSKEYLFENLFLNFNYTSLVSKYIKKINSKQSRSFGKLLHIQIHGNLQESENPINFGFGDEMDGHYKLLEDKNDKDYLENIKSFMYLNNSNYKKLLNWIETDPFQVYIMGHSCGLSDRTLLNTIFEHHNCISIKIFYYDDGKTDRFKELTQNISRHFNKKTLMREKVVDKSLCIELPQSGTK